MKPRNLSPQEMFIRIAQGHLPEFRFERFSESFDTWKASALPRVLETLGGVPESVPMNPELTLEWEDRGVRKRRYLIDVGPHISAVLRVNIPGNLQPGEKRAALFCWHGHGMFGKAPVMGDSASGEIASEIKRCNYDYGHQMAEKGFVTFAIDWMGCGERNDRLKPHFLSTAGDRDWCNLYYLHATMLGMTPLSINLAHGRVATDFVSNLAEVDPERLGVMGMSGGGTMTLWTALTDPRFKAAEIICYSDLWALFGIRDINYCGSQVAPGLFKLVDLPDLQGLLAPLPLLVNIGAYDECFQPANALQCYDGVKTIYGAARAEDRLHLDLFPGGHAWAGNKSESFFTRYLTTRTH